MEFIGKQTVLSPSVQVTAQLGKDVKIFDSYTVGQRDVSPQNSNTANQIV